jgi:hypothetical protein
MKSTLLAARCRRGAANRFTLVVRADEVIQ